MQVPDVVLLRPFQLVESTALLHHLQLKENWVVKKILLVAKEQLLKFKDATYVI